MSQTSRADLDKKIAHYSEIALKGMSVMSVMVLNFVIMISGRISRSSLDNIIVI